MNQDIEDPSLNALRFWEGKKFVWPQMRLNVIHYVKNPRTGTTPNPTLLHPRENTDSWNSCQKNENLLVKLALLLERRPINLGGPAQNFCLALTFSRIHLFRARPAPFAKGIGHRRWASMLQSLEGERERCWAALPWKDLGSHGPKRALSKHGGHLEIVAT